MKEPPTPMAKRLRDLREAKGMSQAELAEELGVHQSTITSLELGRYEPRLLTAICLADVLGVTLDYLATGRGDPDRKP